MKKSQEASIALPEYRQFIEQLKARVLSARLCRRTIYGVRNSYTSLIPIPQFGYRL